jgi:hypothetical protein
MSGELPEPPRELKKLEAPQDYGDEIGSQKRVRWMTQVMVMPALVGGLFGFAYLLGYWLGDNQAHLIRELPRLAFVVVILALPSYFMIRGKIGARRRWMNFALLALCLGAGGLLGWRSGDRDFRAEASSVFEPER